MSVRGHRDAVIDAVNVAVHIHGDDQKRVEAAMRQVALANDGVIDPNLVRDQLTGAHGLVVTPQVIGARYMALRRGKIIERLDTTVNRDCGGRNQGKPMWRYRVISPAWLEHTRPPDQQEVSAS